MYQTFHLNTDNLTAAFLKSVRSFFSHREVRITIEEIASKPTVNQQEVFQRMERHRLKLSDVKVDPNLDLSALANEVNDNQV